jgi:hypothetical protein
MTVAQLRAEMSNKEYVQWVAWHGLKRQREELAAKRR